MGVQDCANDLVKCAGSFGMIADAGTRIASIDVNPFLIDSRLGWLVIPAFCLDVRSVRMWERGCFPTTIRALLRKPCRLRHPYAVPRTSLQCVCTRRRNCIEQLSPSLEYPPGQGSEERERQLRRPYSGVRNPGE
jgi:hypothetical protein